MSQEKNTQGAPSPAPGGQKSPGEVRAWLLTGLLLLVYTPLGLLALVFQLVGRSELRRRLAAEGDGAEKSAHATGAYPSRDGGRTPGRHGGGSGTLLITVGSVVVAIFGAISLVEFWSDPVSAWLAPLSGLYACASVAGLGLLWAGLRQRKKLVRQRRYRTIIGTRRNITIAQLCQVTGCTAAEVCRDVEEMLDEGLFPGGYLSYGSKMLVCAPEDLEEFSPY